MAPDFQESSPSRDRFRSAAVRPTVLLADDSAEQRWTLRLALSMMGFEVEEVSDGRELFWALEAHSASSRTEPTLVVADVYMPAYNGLDVVEAWRQNRLGSKLIVMTAFPDTVLEQRVTALGARLLAKPFSLADLSAAVKQCMASPTEA